MSCAWIHPEVLDICQRAAECYRGGGRPYVAFDCASEEEARKLYAEMAARFPDVPVLCHWPPEKREGAYQLSLFMDLEDL